MFILGQSFGSLLSQLFHPFSFFERKMGSYNIITAGDGVTQLVENVAS